MSKLNTLNGLATVAALFLSTSAMAQQAKGNATVMDKVKATTESATGSPLATLDADMRHVIHALNAMGPKPLPKLDATEARKQPGAADAAMQVLREQGKCTLPDPTVMTKNILVDGAKGKIVATIYTPDGATGPLPVIVYYHGGGFVIANNSTYDATPRLLAKQVNAVVVSVEYSKAPEHKFPASHEDANAAYKWVTQNAAPNRRRPDEDRSCWRKRRRQSGGQRRDRGARPAADRAGLRADCVSDGRYRPGDAILQG